jgi:hypothetical protein
VIPQTTAIRISSHRGPSNAKPISSAQFSAAATELADPRYVGTVLSVQLGLGFLLTVGTVGVMPYLADAMGGWRWAFAPLAIGPVIGVAAMLALRARPEAKKLAGGRR